MAKAKKKRKGERVKEAIEAKYKEGGVRYTEDQVMDRLVFVRDRCVDHLVEAVESFESAKGVFMAQELITKTMGNLSMISKYDTERAQKTLGKITVVFQSDEDTQQDDPTVLLESMKEVNEEMKEEKKEKK